MTPAAKLFCIFALAATLTTAAPRPAPQKLDASILQHLPVADAQGPPPGPVSTGKPILSVDEAVDKAVNNFVDSKQTLAKAKRAVVPAGYTLVFENLNGATEAPTYMTFKTLNTYSPQECTDFCDANPMCSFANLFVEHNAQGTFNKCSLYTLSSTAASATNIGQWRDGVLVTITNSNGYARSPPLPDVPGYTRTALDGAINAARQNPTDPDPYMGFTAVVTSDPRVCGQVCEEKTTYNSQHPENGKYTACNFFNFYALYKNDQGFQTICSFYLKPFDNSFATNHGYTYITDVYTIVGSYGYSRNVLIGEGGVVTV